jgi:hypothetical protein
MHLAIPVVAGLVIGIFFVVAVAWTLTPASMSSDEALIAKYSRIPEVRYFLEKHPEAQFEVERIPNEGAVIVYYRVERQVEPASEWNSGVNVLSVELYKDRMNKLALGVGCGVSQGMTIGVGIVDKTTIDIWEEKCFTTSGGNVDVFEPDTSGSNADFFETDTTGAELNDYANQFAFMPEG